MYRKKFLKKLEFFRKRPKSLLIDSFNVDERLLVHPQIYGKANGCAKSHNFFNDEIHLDSCPG